MARNRGWHRNDIENPEAYQRAVTASIHGRANAKRWSAWKAAHPHLAEWYETHGGGFDETPQEYAARQDAFDRGIELPTPKWKRHPLGTVPTFIRDAIEKWGAPTENATAVLQRIYDERKANAEKRDEQRAAEAASAQAWTAGRQVVEGVVISIKETEGYGRPYSRYAPPPVYKWLVKRDDGSRIFATIPSAADLGQYDALKGKRVRFTVTVEPKAEEPTFAFGSRPAKASIISPAPAAE